MSNKQRIHLVCYVGGAGRLGWPMAVWTQHRGLDTVVVDTNTKAVEAISAGTYSVREPGVDELWETMSCTVDSALAARIADLIFVLVQSPSLSDGSFDTGFVEAACVDIGLGIAGREDFPVVAIASTVMPGSVEGAIRERLEEASGMKAHKDFGLVYTPESVRQGCILQDFSRPDFVIIGCANEVEQLVLEQYFATVVVEPTSFCPMSIPSAEIAKLALNTYITTKLAKVNEIAQLCHRTPGASARDVLDAIGKDSRISPRFLSPGTPPGGPCFPRDNDAMVAALKAVEVTASLSAGVKWIENDQILWIALEVRRLLERMGLLTDVGGESVGILGLTYKPGVTLTEGSQGVELVNTLCEFGFTVRAYDPAMVIGHSVRSIEELVDSSDVLVLMTAWEHFAHLENLDLSGKAVLDMWGFYNRAALNCDVYVEFGEGV